MKRSIDREHKGVHGAKYSCLRHADSGGGAVRKKAATLFYLSSGRLLMLRVYVWITSCRYGYFAVKITQLIVVDGFGNGRTRWMPLRLCSS